MVKTLRIAFPLYVAAVTVASILPGVVDLGQGGDKYGHFVAYMVMALIGMPLAKSGGERTWMLLVVLGIGAALEGVQGLLAYRTASGWDQAANTAGALAGTLVWLVVLRLRDAR